jgi:hypothetical protein
MCSWNLKRSLIAGVLGVAALWGASLFGDAGLSGLSVAAGDCTVSAADAALDSEEQAFLTIINNYRAQNGVGPVAASYTLSKSAHWKSKDMGVNRYFAHDDLTRTWVQRNRDCGYTANAYLAENIAAGNSTAQATFEQWRNSSGHNTNMLRSNHKAIGIGRAFVSGSPYGWYWTTEFASINDGWPSAPPAGAVDSDGDGCSDTEERGTNIALGGRRDPANRWDFYDVDGSKRIDLADVNGVRARFNVNSPTQPQDRPFDRSTGAQQWAPGPPDNVINGMDVGLVRASFGHDCSGAG